MTVSTAQPDGRSRGAKSARVYIVVDLGGTQTRTAVFDSTGQMLTRRAIATPRTGGPAGVIAAILDQIREAIAQHPGVVAIGVGALGPVAPRTGLIRLVEAELRGDAGLHGAAIELLNHHEPAPA